MIPRTPLPHIREYISVLNETLQEKGHKPLSRIQQGFLCFILMGMLLTQSLCWARLERASGGRYQDGALCKMFDHGQSVLGLSACRECFDCHEAIQYYFRGSCSGR